MLRCPLCGSTRVYTAVWQDLNSGDVQSSDIMPDMAEYYWCGGCQQHPPDIIEAPDRPAGLVPWDEAMEFARSVPGNFVDDTEEKP